MADPALIEFPRGRCVLHFISSTPSLMSKRVNHSNDKPPGKRQRGFRLARSNPELSNSPNTSLFVTVNPHEEKKGTLKAHNRLLSSIEPSAPSLSPAAESGFEPRDDDILDSSGPMEVMEATPPPDIPSKPKRKRYTANVVCC